MYMWSDPQRPEARILRPGAGRHPHPWGVARQLRGTPLADFMPDTKAYVPPHGTAATTGGTPAQ